MKTCLNVPKTCNGVPVESYLEYMLYYVVQDLFFSLLQPKQMETAAGMPKGAIAGAAGTATAFTFGKVEAAGAPFVTTGIVVAAPVA